MPDVRSRYQSLKALRRTGDRLLIGPESLRPPKAVDEVGWLDCAVRIVHGGIGVDWSSVAVFVDNTMNRGDNFLTPVARRARWPRQSDLSTLPAAPSVAVQLLDLTKSLKELNDRVRMLQATMRSLSFDPFGLPLDRSGPTLPRLNDDDPSIITIELWNGEQHIEYTSPLTDEPFCKEANEFADFVWSLDDVIDSGLGWSEL